MHLISDPHFPFLSLIIPVAYAFTPTPQLDKNSSIDDRGQRATGPGTERDQRKKISQRREPSQSSVSWAYFPAPCSPSLPPSLSPPPPLHPPQLCIAYLLLSIPSERRGGGRLSPAQLIIVRSRLPSASLRARDLICSFFQLRLKAD